MLDLLVNIIVCGLFYCFSNGGLEGKWRKAHFWTGERKRMRNMLITATINAHIALCVQAHTRNL